MNMDEQYKHNHTVKEFFYDDSFNDYSTKEKFQVFNLPDCKITLPSGMIVTFRSFYSELHAARITMRAKGNLEKLLTKMNVERNATDKL